MCQLQRAAQTPWLGRKPAENRHTGAENPARRAVTAPPTTAMAGQLIGGDIGSARAACRTFLCAQWRAMKALQPRVGTKEVKAWRLHACPACGREWARHASPGKVFR